MNGGMLVLKVPLKESNGAKNEVMLQNCLYPDLHEILKKKKADRALQSGIAGII